MATDRRKRIPGRKKRRRRPAPIGGGKGSGLLVMLAVVFAVIASIAIFFRVNRIEVRGNSIYDAGTITEASGLQQGDNLLAVNKSAVAGKLRAALPYVEQVRVIRQLPDTIVLNIRESDAVLSVRDDAGGTWLMSFGGKILEEGDGKPHAEAKGFTLREPAVGESAQSEQTENLETALLLLSQLSGTGLADKITEVDVSKPYAMTLRYTDQYEIRLGGTQRLEYKLRYLMAILEQLSPYQTGVIDVSLETENNARFIPW